MSAERPDPGAGEQPTRRLIDEEGNEHPFFAPDATPAQEIGLKPMSETEPEAAADPPSEADRLGTHAEMTPKERAANIANARKAVEAVKKLVNGEG